MIEKRNNLPPSPSAEGRSALPAADRGVSVILPPKIPLQIWRRTQSNIPNERAERDRLRHVAALVAAERAIVPPLTLVELREHAIAVCRRAGVNEAFADFCAVLVNNEAWRDTMAQVPYDRRLLLLPKCLRAEALCPAPFDEFGLVCKDCGMCSIETLASEAERLGYAVLVAEGSALVRKMVETGQIEAIVGVSCLNVLERCFPHMEAAAIPGLSIPLLQDDCVGTNVDLDQVWDVIHLTSEDKTYRLDLEELKGTVQEWFTPESLAETMGPANGETEEIAREWLGRAGKRWRPYLTACVTTALRYEDAEERPPLSPALAKLGVAVECFHKASLIHDDIEDGDLVRYGEQSLHAQYGVPIALNVGDMLLGEGYRLISEVDVAPDTKVAMLAEAVRGHVTLSRGQGAELCWSNAPRPLSSLEVLEIFRQKTAPAFEVALRLGALFAGAEPDVHVVLGEYSESLGIAYQIRDDLEDFTGTSDSDDLADLRPSLILAIAHRRARGGEESARIEALWRREISFEDVRAEVEALLEDREVVKKTRELRDAYKAQAISSLRALTNPSLKGLLRRVIGKIFGDELLIEGYCSDFETRNAAGGAPGDAPSG